jgi:hypothetical protein
MGNVAIDAVFSGNAKLFVGNSDKDIGIMVKHNASNNNSNVGVFSIISSNTYQNQHIIGVYGEAIGDNCDVKCVIGVNGKASGGLVNIGVRGIANTINDCYKGYNIGIYGRAENGTQSYAGYFAGNVAYNQLPLCASDINLKKNINSIDNAMSILMQLNPVSFNYKSVQYDYMSFTNKLQYGLIAQEVEPILPNLIDTAYHPAEYDSLGIMISPSVEFKTLKYTEFIPFLIKGTQELKQENNLLENRIDSLENILNSYQSQFDMLDSLMIIVGNLSNNANPNTNQNSMVENFKITYKEYVENNNTVLYQNNPNPFKEETEFSYSLAESGTVLFEIHNEQGKLIQVLADELQTEGKHIIHWDSNNLETGIYIYSLKFNGELLVKKAIKIK